MNTNFSFADINDPSRHLDIRAALNGIVADQKASRDQLADDLGVSLEHLNLVLDTVDPEGVTGWVAVDSSDVEAWLAIQNRLVEVLTHYGVLAGERCDAAGVPNTALAVCGADQADDDPFGESAEDIAAEETRDKAALFAWADSLLGMSEAELELELDLAAKRFGRSRAALSRIVKARRSEKQGRSQPHVDAPEDDVRYYGTDFRVSRRGVFARRIDSQGTPFWECISTTRMDIEALTRDGRAENWGAYVVITNRDGGMKKLAIPYALTAADRAAEIAALLASLGRGRTVGLGSAEGAG
jgi:hypothetical protein